MYQLFYTLFTRSKSVVRKSPFYGLLQVKAFVQDPSSANAYRVFCTRDFVLSDYAIMEIIDIILLAWKKFTRWQNRSA